MSAATDKFDAKIKEIVDEAREAGEKAARATGHIVTENGRERFAEHGPCGFAYTVFPRNQRKLTNAFKRLNKDAGHSGYGYAPFGSSTYEGCWYGWDIAPQGMAAYTQCINVKEAYCSAMAEVFRNHGFEAQMVSRLD